MKSKELRSKEQRAESARSGEQREKKQIADANNFLAFLYRRWYLFRIEKYRGRFMIDEKYFEEKFSALKAHIEA
jgi:hypothetical protein